MKTVESLLYCLLAFPLVGTVSTTTPGRENHLKPALQSISADHALLEDRLEEGRRLIHSGQLAEAESHLENLHKSAFELKEYRLAARGKGNVGVCQFKLHRYAEAARSFLEAIRLAERAGDSSGAGIFEANLASLYSELGEIDSAVEWTERSMARLEGKDRREHLASLQIQMASFRARQNRMSESIELFRRGIETADRDRNHTLYALGWNRLGEELVRHKNYAAAESAFLEAYRVRNLLHLPLEGSYTNLARLRLESGDLAAAGTMLDRAMEQTARLRDSPARDVYRLRGQVRLAELRFEDALADLRVAVRLERAWRWSSPTGDRARVSAEGLLADVHGALIDAGNRLYLQTGDAALIRETFEAAEENRANSLRLLVESRRSREERLPAAYWEAIAKLQDAEAGVLRGLNGAEAAAKKARAQLIRVEADSAADGSAGSEPVTLDLLERVRGALDADSAMLSFHLGESVSWLWAVDRDGLLLYRLPARKLLQAQVEAAASAIRGGDRGAEAGARLYRTLFGSLGPRFQRKSRWLLALDTYLFEAPLAALVTDAGGHPAYLVERHTLEVIAGAGTWLDAQRYAADERGQLFLGIGDPIYNTADPRLSRRKPNLREWFFGPPAETAPMLLLPRLVGSGPEIAACARSWEGESVLLRGADVSRNRILEELHRDPAVVHFATHFVESSDRSASAMIPLGIRELLPAAEISHWKVRPGLVVLSGCHSAAGAALRGTGLLGLTRGWLSAGARSVVGSRWATPDEDGALFQALYRDLRANRRKNSAEALRSAQLAMIRAGGWRAEPRYWGAYFMVGNQ